MLSSLQDRAAYLQLLERSAEYHFQRSMHAEALALYERLLALGPSKTPNLRYLSRAVQLSSKFDLERAALLAKQLPSLPGLQDVDLKSLDTVAAAPRGKAASASAAQAKEDIMPVYDPANNLRFGTCTLHLSSFRTGVFCLFMCVSF